jgi:polyisoprenoid-binding protein YceI
MKRLAALAATAVCCAAAQAASETYSIEGSHTLPRFDYNHLGYSEQSSRFDKTTGTIVIDRAARTGSVDVTIDTNSVNTGSAKFNEHLKGEDFFDTAKYPTITYKSDKLRFEGDRLTAVDGTLTIKGVSKPVTLKVTSFLCKRHPIMQKDACGANAVARIKRSDFGMGKYAPAVSDEVTLVIPVEALKVEGPAIKP